MVRMCSSLFEGSGAFVHWQSCNRGAKQPVELGTHPVPARVRDPGDVQAGAWPGHVAAVLPDPLVHSGDGDEQQAGPCERHERSRNEPEPRARRSTPRRGKRGEDARRAHREWSTLARMPCSAVCTARAPGAFAAVTGVKLTTAPLTPAGRTAAPSAIPPRVPAIPPRSPAIPPRSLAPDLWHDGCTARRREWRIRCTTTDRRMERQRRPRRRPRPIRAFPRPATNIRSPWGPTGRSSCTITTSSRRCRRSTASAYPSGSSTPRAEAPSATSKSAPTSANGPGPLSLPKSASARRSWPASRPWRASKATRTPIATRAGSPSSSTRRRGTTIWSATTRRCSSSATRPGSRTSSTPRSACPIRDCGATTRSGTSGRSARSPSTRWPSSCPIGGRREPGAT